jgi:hypothetical protein
MYEVKQKNLYAQVKFVFTFELINHTIKLIRHISRFIRFVDEIY